MRAILAVALLLTLVLAGCASKGGGGKDDDGTTPTGTASGTATGSGTSSASQTGTASSTSTGTGGPANRAPSGAIAVVLNGTSARFELTGTDADGDALSWRLDFGDNATTNGTSLPANVTHTYTPGNHTAVYNVTDGQATSSYNVSVTVTTGGGAGLTLTGGVDNFCTLCTEALGEQDGSEPASPFPSVSWMNGEQGIDAIWAEIPAALVGHAWSATTTGPDVAIAAFTECGPAGHFIEMVDTGAVPEVGTVPEGTGCMVVWEYFAYVPPPLGTPSTPGPQTLTLTIG